MATPVDPAYRQHLQALAEKYGASVPQRMAAIADALHAAGAVPDDAALVRVHESLHAVAGSAGSFGYRMLGEQARRLEQLTRQAMAGEVSWTTVMPQVASYLAWAAIDPFCDTYPSHD